MPNRFIAPLLLVAAIASDCLAADMTSDIEQQRRLAEQKLKLVEMLVNSPKAQASAASNDAETVTLIERGKELLRQAREALAAQQYAAAGQAPATALQNLSRARSPQPGRSRDSTAIARCSWRGATSTSVKPATAAIRR